MLRGAKAGPNGNNPSAPNAGHRSIPALLGKGRKSALSAWAPLANATSSSRKSSSGFALHNAGSLASTLFLRSKSSLLLIALAAWLELAPVGEERDDYVCTP